MKSIFIATPWGKAAVSDHFRRLGNGLADRGFRVVFLVPGQMNNIVSPDTNPAIYTWPSIRPTKLADARFLNKLINQYHPVCLIANFAADNIMALVGWIRQVPIRVIWYHTLLEQIKKDGMPLLKMEYLVNRKRFVFKTITDLIPVSCAALTDLQSSFKVPKSKCTVFYNALIDPLSDPSEPISSPNRMFIVCVGRIVKSKGQDLLITALGQLVSNYPDIQVDFIGDGDMKEKYQRLVEEMGLVDHCNFKGRMGHAAVLALMGHALATIVPSRDEAFGLVNIESMSVGTPVIASNVGGIPEIVTDGKDGLLFPAGDVQALAGKIIRLVENPVYRDELGRNARQTFLERFEDTRAVQEQVRWLEGRIDAAIR